MLLLGTCSWCWSSYYLVSGVFTIKFFLFLEACLSQMPRLPIVITCRFDKPHRKHCFPPIFNLGSACLWLSCAGKDFLWTAFTGRIPALEVSELPWSNLDSFSASSSAWASLSLTLRAWSNVLSPESSFFSVVWLLTPPTNWSLRALVR